jgi:hypothetical protein
MKSYIGVGGCALALAVSAAANAADFQPGLYNTVGYEALWPTYKNGVGALAPSMLNGFDVGAGWRFNRYYTVEGSYGYATGTSSFLELSAQTISLDGMGYLPFGKGSGFALLSDVGVSDVFGHATTAFGRGDSSAFGPHIGAGAQIQFSDTIGLRGIVKYQWANFDLLDGATVGTVDLIWRL